MSGDPIKRYHSKYFLKQLEESLVEEVELGEYVSNTHHHYG